MAARLLRLRHWKPPQSHHGVKELIHESLEEAEIEQINFKAQMQGIQHHDNALASQEKAVRDNAKKIGLSKRETQKRVNSVRKRFNFK